MHSRIERWIVVVVGIALLAGCGGSSDGAGGDDMGVSMSDNEYAFTALNAMRAAEVPGAMPFARHASLDAFATASNDEFDTTRMPHTYIMTNPITCTAPVAPMSMSGASAENEGLAGPGLSNTASIDAILAFFLAERDAFPPGHPDRGHYEAIVNAGFNTTGIAIKRSSADGSFVMTQEFCD